MSFLPTYKVTGCHNCLKTSQISQVTRKTSLFFTYVPLFRPIYGFLSSERTEMFRVFFLLIFFFSLVFFLCKGGVALQSNTKFSRCLKFKNFHAPNGKLKKLENIF